MNSRACVFLSLLVGASAFHHVPTSPTVIRAGGASRQSPSKLSLVHENDNEGDGGEGSHLIMTSRRSFCARSLAATIAVPSILSAASPSYAEESTTTEPYDDPDYGFRLQVPSSWEKTTQELSGRRKAVFFTDPNSKDAATGGIETLGFIAYTQIRDDYTSLSSFGSVDEVAQATIMPKGELAVLDDTSKMISAVSKNSAYYFDYVTTPVVPVEPGKGSVETTKTLKQQHFRTIFTLLPLKNSAGLTLITITLQTTEERYRNVKGMFDGIVDSFGKKA